MKEQVRFIDRRNTNCCKWDGQTDNFGEEGLQAMWVADMDFQVADSITAALSEYLKMGAFGYYKVPESYYESFLKWQETYHNHKVDREALRFAPGVVPAINWLLQIFTKEGDAVIVQTPVYYPFISAVENNKRTLVCCELVNTNGVYTIDFEAFEAAVIAQNVKVFIFCSPHNPVGRVWKKDEIQKLVEICERHHVLVISDEIHQDIILNDHVQYPTAAVGSDDSMIITLTAASKTFNLASSQNAFVIIQNQSMRAKFDIFTQEIRINHGNAFGYIAVEAAYKSGRGWFEEVRAIIEGNAAYVEERFARELPEAEVSPLEGTYLQWVNLNAYLKPEEVKDVIQGKCRLAFDYGEWFGGEHFTGYVRINLATSRKMVEKAVDVMVEALAH